MHRDIELPPSGAQENVATAFPTIFNWDYKIRRDELLRLYEKGKTLQWNAATDIDWSIDVDPERIRVENMEAFDAVLQQPQKLDAPTRRRMKHHMDSWMLSQFMHGEQGALVATAQLVS